MSKFPGLFEVSWISEIARKSEIPDFAGNLDPLALYIAQVPIDRR